MRDWRQRERGERQETEEKKKRIEKGSWDSKTRPRTTRGKLVTDEGRW